MISPIDPSLICDSDLLRNAERGCVRSQTELYRRYFQQLLAIVDQKIAAPLRPRFDAEDVVQSAYRSFFGLVSKGKTEHIDDDDELRGLLVSIAINKLKAQARKHLAIKRNPNREATKIRAEQVAKSRDEVANIDVVLRDEIQWLLSEVPVVNQRVLVLLFDGNTISEIAVATGKSERTVRRIRQSAWDKLEDRNASN